MEWKIGTFVTYKPTGEKGRVKKRSGDKAFVVFQCNDDWENFTKYTAMMCPIGYLERGWAIPDSGLEDGSIMQFGEHGGKTLDNVPASWLLWWLEQTPERPTWLFGAALHDYIQDNYEVLLDEQIQ